MVNGKIAKAGSTVQVDNGLAKNLELRGRGKIIKDVGNAEGTRILTTPKATKESKDPKGASPPPADPKK